jgi:hypothetical protein
VASSSSCATTLLPKQAKPSRSIKRIVLPIRQFFLGLALGGSCQAALHRVCKPQVGQAVLLTACVISIPFFISKGGLVDPRLCVFREQEDDQGTRSFLLPQVLKHIPNTSAGRSNYRRMVYVFAD